MRHNAATIVETVGLEVIAVRAHLMPEQVTALLAGIAADVERLPVTAEEIALDQALVCAAVGQAVTRHCARRDLSTRRPARPLSSTART